MRSSCATLPCPCCRPTRSTRAVASSAPRLGRFVVARELIRAAREHGCRSVAHSSATRGNDQLRLEAALAALSPDLEVVAPLRLWNLRTRADLLTYARRRHLPLEEPSTRPLTVDRNLWGASSYLDDLTDSWEEPPPEVFTLTRAADQAPDIPVFRTLGFEAGVPRSLDGRTLDLVPLVRALNELGGTHGIGRSDVIEDRLFGIKVREFYEAPAATVLRAAHRDLEALVHSRELRDQKEALARQFAALVYAGHWFHDLRRAFQAFVAETQNTVTGEVRLRLFKGTCQVVGRRSPNSLYDGRLASQVNSSQFDGGWAQALSALWSLPGRLAARASGTCCPRQRRLHEATGPGEGEARRGVPGEAETARCRSSEPFAYAGMMPSGAGKWPAGRRSPRPRSSPRFRLYKAASASQDRGLHVGFGFQGARPTTATASNEEGRVGIRRRMDS